MTYFKTFWFNVILFFAEGVERDRRTPKNLKKTCLKFEVDSMRQNYATMGHEEASRNHPGGVGDILSMEKYARMYETTYE